MCIGHGTVDVLVMCIGHAATPDKRCLSGALPNSNPMAMHYTCNHERTDWCQHFCDGDDWTHRQMGRQIDEQGAHEQAD